MNLVKQSRKMLQLRAGPEKTERTSAKTQTNASEEDVGGDILCVAKGLLMEDIATVILPIQGDKRNQPKRLCR